jgi:DNA-binding transcriptional MerR regulator
VSGYSRQEVAQRAGVDPDYLDRLVELGILTPGTGDLFSTGDVRRARWVRDLENSGVPLDGMAAAVRDGALSFSYLDASAFDRFAGMSTATLRELSEETGVPLELLKVLREALGFAEPGPEDTVREDERSIVPAIELQLSQGVRPVVIERWLRVCADGLRRIAATETDLWRTDIEQPLLRGGYDGGADAGDASRPRLGHRPPDGAGPLGHLPRPAGARLDQQRSSPKLRGPG